VNAEDAGELIKIAIALADEMEKAGVDKFTKP